jgi:hypothetical protein
VVLPGDHQHVLEGQTSGFDRDPDLAVPNRTGDRDLTGDEAERLYSDALEWCEREHCGVDAGRCHQGLADIAERRGDKALATEHLDAAGELFSQYGAKLYRDQVIAKKEILKA